MDREKLRSFAADKALALAPGLGAEAIDRVLEAPRVRAWLDYRARRRPRGVVAFFRRVFGSREEGLSAVERQELTDMLRRELQRRH
jgi:hypothetical protein